MSEPRWRVGRTLGRTLYRDNVCVGMVDTPDMAEDIVAAMNNLAAPASTPGAPAVHPGCPAHPATPERCPCGAVENRDGNAEVTCHRCGRVFRANVCVACAGSGRVSLDPVTEWKASSGLAPVAKAVVMFAPECSACKGLGATASASGSPMSVETPRDEQASAKEPK